MSDLPNYATPHCHPQSLDTASVVAAFVAREQELGTGAVTATDHGSLAACREVYDLCHGKDPKTKQPRGLTPILGIEGYMRDDNCPILRQAGLEKRHYALNGTTEDQENAVRYPHGTYRDDFKYGHVTIHLLDQPAYETCSAVLSEADERAEVHGTERKPLFDWAALERLGAQNVTMGSGCLIGMVQRHLMERGDAQTAIAYYERLRATVKPGNFYVEVFPHDCSRNWVNALFVALDNGERLRFTAKSHSYKGKMLRVSGEELRADQLLQRKEWGVLQATQDYRHWNDREPHQITNVERVEGFIENECRDWAGTSDIQAACNRFMVGLARAYGDPVLVSDDAHYAYPDDKAVQDMKLAQSGTWRFYGHYHRQSSAESFAHFQRSLGTSEAEFRGWVENNQAWAARFKGFRFNTPISLPTKFYPEDTMAHLGQLIQQHGRMRWDDPRYRDRLEREIAMLHDNGTIDLLPYFFVAEEAVGVYNAAGRITGPGRGSAAGLLLAFVLGITHIDPLKYDLSLERFITLDRIKSGAMPDIDMDFPGRELLTAPDGWLARRFGDHQVQVGTNMTLKARAACKDACRMTHGHVPPEAEVLTKRFEQPPQGINDRDHIEGYVAEDGKEVRGAISYDVALQEFAARYPREWKLVLKALGLTRSQGRHASGWLIMNRPVRELIPVVQVSEEDEKATGKATQFTAAACEAMGAIKMDFLVVNSLIDIGDAVRLIQARAGVEIPKGGKVLPNRGLVPAHQLVPFKGDLLDVWDLPDDEAVALDIVEGRGETVFQFNTESAQGWLAKFRGRRPDGRPAIAGLMDLAVFTALDRPGPLDAGVPDPERPGLTRNMLEEYAARVQGHPRSTGILPVMEQLLPKTEGVMVFQEQLQYMYQHLTSCAGPEAEEFRRNVAKKKMDKVEKAFSFFFPRASQMLGEENARKAWETFVTFGQYGFNMSHAVCYAFIGYVCAWLKHHYNREWWCAVLRNATKNEIVEKFWVHCGSMIDLPDLSRAAPTFQLDGDRIVAPLSLLHGMGPKAHEQLLRYAPYQDLPALVRSVEQFKRDTGREVIKLKKNKKTGVETPTPTFKAGTSAVNRRIIYTMLIVGAMDRLLPPEIRSATILEKLAYYEQVVQQVVQSMTPPKANGKTKQVRLHAVPEWYGQVGALARYVLCKQFLPVYGADLRPVLAELGRPGVERGPNGGLIYHGKKVVDGAELRFLEKLRPLPEGGVDVAVLAYVSSVRAFSFDRDGQTKHAHEVSLDIAGESFRMVAWQGRKATPFPTDVEHALCLVRCSRWSDDRGFSIAGIEVVQRVVKEPEGDDGEADGDREVGAGDQAAA